MPPPLPLPLPLPLPQTPPPLAPCSRVRFECWVSGMRRLENVNMNCINLPGRHSLPLRLNPIVAQPLGKLSRQRLYGFSASYSALTRSKCKRTKKYQAARWRWSESLLVLVLVVHSKKLGWQWAGFRECFPNFVILFIHITYIEVSFTFKIFLESSFNIFSQCTAHIFLGRPTKIYGYR